VAWQPCKELPAATGDWKQRERAQPEVLMATSLIDSVANTTSHRDRDDLDRAIVGLLLQYLDAEQVTMFRLVEEADTQQLRRAVALNRSALESGHPSSAASGLAADLGQPSIPVDENPAWHESITEQRSVYYKSPDGKSCAAFPITNDRAVIGMLEIQSATGLGSRDSILVEGILRIMKNHLALLDYGESDTLTGLLNRKTFDSRFGKLRAGSGARSAEEPSWLGIVDVDKFKSINDNFGHLFGDEVLLLVARLLKQAFRGADQLFRFGGEEFIIVLDRATTPGAQIAFNRARTMVEEYRFPQVGRVTISLGFTRIDPQDAAGTCIERADAALYYAKNHGRNNVQSYEMLVEAGELKAKQSGVTDVELF
jgi:diguanylate cyclase (GGDEF)-like protein